jgi:hypothetical protein
VDLIFVYQYDNNYFIKALINSFSPSDVCSGNAAGTFPYGSLDFFSLFDLGLGTNATLMDNSSPRFNDLNADGYPDIMALLNNNGYTKVNILINQGGSGLNFYKY